MTMLPPAHPDLERLSALAGADPDAEADRAFERGGEPTEKSERVVPPGGAERELSHTESRGLPAAATADAAHALGRVRERDARIHERRGRRRERQHPTAA